MIPVKKELTNLFVKENKRFFFVFLFFIIHFDVENIIFHYCNSFIIHLEIIFLC